MERFLYGAAKRSLVLLAGGTLYCAIEVAWRGYTHISMAICGAVCFYIMFRLEEMPRFRSFSLILRALAGACVITAAEFLTGCAVNLWLGLGVWDYSGVPLSFLGQICLPYSVLWVFLSLAVFPLCDVMRKGIFCA